MFYDVIDDQDYSRSPEDDPESIFNENDPEIPTILGHTLAELEGMTREEIETNVLRTSGYEKPTDHNPGLNTVVLSVDADIYPKTPTDEYSHAFLLIEGKPYHLALGGQGHGKFAFIRLDESDEDDELCTIADYVTSFPQFPMGPQFAEAYGPKGGVSSTCETIRGAFGDTAVFTLKGDETSFDGGDDVDLIFFADEDMNIGIDDE
jgi:hypothetical protein